MEPTKYDMTYPHKDPGAHGKSDEKIYKNQKILGPILRLLNLPTNTIRRFFKVDDNIFVFKTY
jgi:hypothetical protein